MSSYEQKGRSCGSFSDAYQNYKDGSVVECTGNEGSDAPHSITDIVVSTSADDHHDDQPKRKKQKKKKLKQWRLKQQTRISQIPSH
ncbi:hypothetical protein [Bacillus salipaludis]|uniref:hypothetical protein n=1 Tax=Bacillus salipaludis TaxID=2547811 RepID=UPI002E1BDC49|nr:hypothetical protein [Bacillus salipaludis]